MRDGQNFLEVLFGLMNKNIIIKKVKNISDGKAFPIGGEQIAQI